MNISKYLDYELCAHRCYTITVTEGNEMVEIGEIIAQVGCEYIKDGVTYFDFHVDDH